MTQPTVVGSVAGRLAARSAWQPLEIVFWAAALASIFFFSNRYLILTEVAILGLFASTLPGLVSLFGCSTCACSTAPPHMSNAETLSARLTLRR